MEMLILFVILAVAIILMTIATVKGVEAMQLSNQCIAEAKTILLEEE